MCILSQVLPDNIFRFPAKQFFDIRAFISIDAILIDDNNYIPDIRYHLAVLGFTFLKFFFNLISDIVGFL